MTGRSNANQASFLEQLDLSVAPAAPAAGKLRLYYRAGVLRQKNSANSELSVITSDDSRLTDARTPTAHTHPATDVSDSTAAGRTLLTAADASAQRTALGLGTLATQSGTFSGSSSGTNTGDQTITLTGNVTGSGTGSFAATIANDAVTNAKLANMATQTIKGRNTAATGDPEDLAPATVRTMLGLAAIATSGSASDLSTGTLPAARLPAHTGDVTSSAGSAALTIANNAVTLAKLADMATASLIYRKTAGTGDPEVQTLATLKTDLGTMPPDAHNQAWSTITSTPTTLAGYGITDAAPLSHVGAGGAAHAEATTSVSGFMSAADKTKLDGITGISLPIKAWAKLTVSAGVITVVDSSNVSSVVRTAAGRWKFTFTSAMAGTDYGLLSHIVLDSATDYVAAINTASGQSQTTTICEVLISNLGGATVDPSGPTPINMVFYEF